MPVKCWLSAELPVSQGRSVGPAGSSWLLGRQECHSTGAVCFGCAEFVGFLLFRVPCSHCAREEKPLLARGRASPPLCGCGAKLLGSLSVLCWSNEHSDIQQCPVTQGGLSFQMRTAGAMASRTLSQWTRHGEGTRTARLTASIVTRRIP